MRALLFLLVSGVTALAAAEEFRVAPYTDPRQLDCPWPQTSHYLQPWRGYIETKSGAEFLRGIGINLHIPDRNEALSLRLLAETGFKAARIEIGWGESNWDETKLNREESLRRRLELCGKYGIRPTILINAHQGVPCPMLQFKRRLTAPAPRGSKSLLLDDVGDLVIGRSGISGLSGYWAAEALVTAIDYEKREVTLSKSLPKDLPAGEVTMATLKYAPLHAVGMPEFDETAAGWVAHTLRACRLAKSAGVPEFDVEIWNELTFGTHFLNVNDYYDKDAPKIPGRQPDFLNAGGRCWELARRIVEAVHAEFPTVRCIWGFSNTTFYHTAVEKLPPGTDGQSYHPYGTGTRKVDLASARKDQPALEGFVPSYEIRMPEGVMQTFVQTECLIRHLNPLDRLTKKPRGTARFSHYMTEHGVLPAECGVTDEAGAWELKALCATRSFCLWLNKGIDTLHFFVAHEKDPKSFGILPANVAELAEGSSFDEVATPPMKALRNLTRAFRGSVPIAKTQPLLIDVTALGEQTKVFEGDATHPPLWTREVIAALPFQVDASTHLVAVYAMTRDATKRMEPMKVRLKITGGFGTSASCYDPHEDKQVPIQSRAVEDGVEVTLPVVDHPRLVKIGR